MCTDSTAYYSAYFGQNSAVIIALDDVACTVYESRLIDCLYDSHIADCTHSEDAGVQCVPRELQGQIYSTQHLPTPITPLSVVQHVLLAIPDSGMVPLV